MPQHQITPFIRVASVGLFFIAGCASPHEVTQAPSSSTTTISTGDSGMTQHSGMPHRITGSFDVTLTPQADQSGVGDPFVGRMSLDKQFHGELEAVSKGQMLGMRTATKGSAGYVAMERVVGTLAGRTGTFVLQHSSTMTRGAPRQSIDVVPDSGTDQLAGLTGSMTIDNTDGKHLYTFEYAFDVPKQP